MTTDFAQSRWASLISASATAVIVGFASTILVVMAGAAAVGATPAQQASAAASLCYGMAITSFILAWRYRMPIITAWSTPGSVLIATSAAGVSYEQAIGAYMFAAGLMLLTAAIRPLERAIERMPASIAAAMLAGVLLRFVLGVPGAALSAPSYGVPLVLAFFAFRMVLPLYAVPLTVVLGLILALLLGSFAGPVPITITPLTWDWPDFETHALIGLGIPLYLVTMAGQNLPGFAVLRANGYSPPVAASLAVTGAGSLVFAPFGSHALNLAAITASLVAGPESHADPRERWKTTFPYFVFYVLVGLAAATFVSTLGALPKDLVTIIAGLALFAPLMNGLSAMVKPSEDLEAAAVTFLVTASGFSLGGVGSAFWGLLAGLALWGVKLKLNPAK